MLDAERYRLIGARHETGAVLRPVRTGDVEPLARAFAAIDPWHAYGATVDELARFFDPEADDGARRFALADDHDRALGLVIVRWPWLLGPYVAFLAVVPGQQRCGLGSGMLALIEGEARAHGQRNVWLCVTGFNVAAQAFYQGQGYQQVACLDDLIADGTPELLMRKRL